MHLQFALKQFIMALAEIPNEMPSGVAFVLKAICQVGILIHPFTRNHISE